ncbi:MAG: hypothetical protein ACF8GE_09030 [Phycisphaerales bacterium JB043]
MTNLRYLAVFILAGCVSIDSLTTRTSAIAHSSEDDSGRPAALERLSGMLGVRTGTFTAYNQDGEIRRERPIRWETAWRLDGMCLGMEFIIFDESGDTVTHWLSSFYASGDETIETYWVNWSLRHAEYDAITARSFFAEHGQFDQEGVLELRSHQRYSDTDELVLVRSRYTIRDDGSFEVFDERLDGDAWIPMVRFSLRQPDE